jgi:hypothetical protein
VPLNQIRGSPSGSSLSGNGTVLCKKVRRQPGFIAKERWQK